MNKTLSLSGYEKHAHLLFVFFLLITGFISAIPYIAHGQISGPSQVCAGYTASLTATPAGGTWSSSAPSVATIGSSSGIVSALAVGTTTISYFSSLGTMTAVVTVNPVPSMYTVTGGGTICAGSTGRHIGLSFSASGVNYQLYVGASPVGSPLAGTSSPLDFGLQAGAGAYTVVGTYAATACVSTMTGSATITVNPLPAAFSGPSGLCPGASATLTSSPSGGTWASGATTVATVGSSTGTVTGVTTGSAPITYTLTSTGCATTGTVTVSPPPCALTPPPAICSGTSVTLTDCYTGGSWSSSAASVAVVGTYSGIATGIGAGTATITYSLGTGCSVTTTLSVTASPAAISGPSTVCTGATALETDGTASGTWSSSTVAAGTISPAGVVTGISPGSTLITYAAAGCIAAKNITVNPVPSAISGPSSVCIGSYVSESDFLSGGTWTVLPTTIASIDPIYGTVTGVAAGTAMVTYTAGGCPVISPITVNATAAIAGPPDVCVGLTAAFTDALAGGTWSSSSTSIAVIGSSSGSLTGISSGTAIISYTLGSGCLVILPVAVDPFSAITGPSAVCMGQTIIASDTTAGGVWSSSNATVAAVRADGLVTGVTAGAATISYSLPGGCTATRIVTVTTSPSGITGSHRVCVGSMVALGDASPSGTWRSSNPLSASVSSSGAVMGIAPGTDTLSYTFTGGCAAMLSFTVDPLPAAVSGPGSVCMGGTISLTDASTGGVWSGDASAIAVIGSSSGMVTGLSVGVSDITYTLPTGCLASVTVTVNPATPPILGTLAICAGNTTVLTDFSAGGTWTSANTTAAMIDPVTGSLTALSPGRSLITYSTGAGCNASATVTVNPVPSAVSGATLVCQGVSVTLSDATGGGVWSTGSPSVAVIGATTGVLTGIAAGIANVTYTISTGCNATSALIVEPAPATITGTLATCPGQTTLLTDATTGGVWSSSNTSVATIDISGIVTGVATGAATISYIAPTGCITTRVISINPFPGGISSVSAVCAGSSAICADGVAGGSWASADPGVLTISSGTGVMAGITAGVTTITYSTGSGCFVTRDITVNPLPAPVSGPSAVCTGATVSLSDATMGGTWTSGTPHTATAGSLSGIVSGLSAGVVTITYTQICATTFLLTVNQTPSPLTGSFNTCAGGTTVLSDSYMPGTWTSVIPAIATVGSSGLVTGISPGVDTIYYTLPGGCYTSAVVTIYAPPVVFTVTGGGNYCAGGSGVHVGVSNSAVGVNYLLYRGSTAAGTYIGTGGPLDFGLQTVTGTYTVIGTGTLTGCRVSMSGSATVGITPDTIPSVSLHLSPGDSVCSGTPVSYTAAVVNGGAAPVWQWQVNGITVSAAATYSYIPIDGDRVMVKVVSSAACAMPDTVGDSIRMTINTSGMPSITVTATPGDTVCRGTIVTLNSSIAYGGSAPVYSWIKNGAVASSAPLFSFLPANGDHIYCVLQSNYPCRLRTLDTSAAIIMTVDTPETPVVTILASPGTLIPAGDTLILTAIATGAGTDPGYQWYVNGRLIPGATNAVWVVDSFTHAQRDSFSCKVISSSACPATASHTTVISVASVAVPRIAISSGEIRVFPDPSNGDFTISGIIDGGSVSLTEDKLSCQVTNMMGQNVYSVEALIKSGKINERISIAGQLPAGVYHITIRSGNFYQTLPVVIRN